MSRPPRVGTPWRNLFVTLTVTISRRFAGILVMGMTTDGLSYWQAESEGIDLLDTTKEY